MFYRILIAFTVCLLLSSGTAFASFEEGKAAYQKKDWGNTVRLLLPLARNNHDGALLIIGKMYADGQGVPADMKKAFDLFNRAAKLGNPEAMVSAAAFYSAGEGVEKNMKAAFEWFRKAAEMNFSIAQFSLGIALAAGDEENDLKANLPESYKWLMLASRDPLLPPHIKRTAQKLARHARSEEMTPEQRLQGDQALRSWRQKTWEDISATSVYWSEDAASENTPETTPETAPETPPETAPDATPNDTNTGDAVPENPTE